MMPRKREQPSMEKLMADLEEGKFIKPTHVAHAANTSPFGIYKLIREGKIPALHIGTTVRLTPAVARRILGM